MVGKVKMFLSYSHEDEDEAACKDLLKHLGVLRQEKIIEPWTDHDIPAGSIWKDEITNAMNAADLILLLVSPGFISSKFCYSVEMKHAVARHAEGRATVIPIAIADCHWEPAPFSEFQGLPKGLVPISALPKARRNTAYKGVVSAIHETVKIIAARKEKEAKPKTTVDSRLRDREDRLKAFKKELAKSLIRSDAAIDALNAAGARHGMSKVVQTEGLDADPVSLLLALRFPIGLDILQDAFNALDQKGNRGAVKVIQNVARHLIPFLFVASEGMADTQASWERVSGGGLISLKAGHETFAEIIAAGLDLRLATFSGKIDDMGYWPQGDLAVSATPPAGISGGQEDNLREDLWKKVRPPPPSGPLTSAQKDDAINNQLKYSAERRGIRYYMIINDGSESNTTLRQQRGEQVSKRYPVLAITILDSKLYSLHQDLFNDIRDLLAEPVS